MSLTIDDKKFITDTIGFKLDLKLGEQEQKFEALVTKFKDEFYTKIDPILKEVTASREERVMAAAQHRRNQDRIESLERLHPKGKHALASS